MYQHSKFSYRWSYFRRWYCRN